MESFTRAEAEPELTVAADPVAGATAARAVRAAVIAIRRVGARTKGASLVSAPPPLARVAVGCAL